MRILNKSFKGLAVLGLAVGLCLQANAVTLIVGDAYYLGSVVPGTPSSAADEVLYINTLTALATGGSTTIAQPPPGADGDNTLTRSGNVFAFLPTAVEDGAFKDANAPFDPLAPGWQYVLGKFGNDSYVWYVGDITEEISLPSSLNGPGSGLSHVSAYNAVPDGGATMLLVGLALLGVGAVRRRMVPA